MVLMEQKFALLSVREKEGGGFECPTSSFDRESLRINGSNIAEIT